MPITTRKKKRDCLSSHYCSSLQKLLFASYSIHFKFATYITELHFNARRLLWVMSTVLPCYLKIHCAMLHTVQEYGFDYR